MNIRNTILLFGVLIISTLIQCQDKKNNLNQEMKQEIKNEVIEQLENEILFGFQNDEELFESISDMFYDEDNFDDTWLKGEIKSHLSRHQKESLNWQKPTDFDRLVKSFDQLNKEKIISLHRAGYTRQDAEGDCLEIINDLKKIGITAKGYCYYHTQDLERVISEEKTLFIGYDSYNQDNEIAKEVANRIVEILKQNEFKVNWNGSIETRIEILNIDWKKTVDNIDYNYGRVLEIMENYNIANHIEPKQNDNKPFWKFW